MTQLVRHRVADPKNNDVHSSSTNELLEGGFTAVHPLPTALHRMASLTAFLVPKLFQTSLSLVDSRPAQPVRTFAVERRTVCLYHRTGICMLREASDEWDMDCRKFLLIAVAPRTSTGDCLREFCNLVILEEGPVSLSCLG